MEYLYAQTGQVLQDHISDYEESAAQPIVEPLSDVDPDQLDEGFVDNDLDDTVAMVPEVFAVPKDGNNGNDMFIIAS